MPAPITELCYDIADGLVSPALDAGAPILVYGADLTAEQREFLTTEMQIDEHTLQSALDPDEMARVEFEPSHVALIIKRANRIREESGQDFRVASLGAFLFDSKLIFIHTDGAPLFEGRRHSGLCQTLRGALLEVIYQTIARFMLDVRLIHHLSETIEDHIEYSLGNKALSSMFDLQKGLVYYQTALQSNQVLLSKLRMHADRIGFSREERELLDDALVENEQCLKLVEMYSNILTGMSDARVSIISNNLNVIMKKLTVISIIFMPLNIVASMGGMSEWTVFTKGLPWPVSYAAFTAGLGMIGYFTWLLIRNIGVEDRPPRKGRGRRPRRLPAILGALFRH